MGEVAIRLNQDAVAPAGAVSGPADRSAEFEKRAKNIRDQIDAVNQVPIDAGDTPTSPSRTPRNTTFA